MGVSRGITGAARGKMDDVNPKRILVVGAGHVGLYAALRLSKKLSSREAEVVVVDPQPHMTYQPFLPEAAAGNISPRHSVVPLRRELRRCKVVAGTVTRIDHSRRTAVVQPISGPPREIAYDHVVVAPGSVSRTLPIPGLHEHGIGFKTIGEAIYLRNHVLDRLDVAAATPDADVRRSALTFTFVGGGYAGIEALAEMEDMARDALRYYPELKPDDMRWVLVEATQRVLPEVDRDMGAYTVQQLLKRNMDIRLDTRLESCIDGVVKLSDGDSFRSDTIVWTAGVKPSPMLDRTDFPRDERRRVTCLPTLQVVDGDRVVEGRGAPATAPPYRTSPRNRATTARRAPSTPCGRPPGWPTTSRSWCGAGSLSTTSTSTPAASPASACTRASPRCTASR